MDALTMIIVGIVFLPLGILLIKYVREKTKKNQVSNSYDFNLYIASAMLIITAIVLIYVGISNFIKA
jgi:heme/copper-type cytochrome/quinol oxidase subunit 2